MFGFAWSIACSITWAQTDQQIAWKRKRSFTHTMMTQCIYIYIINGVRLSESKLTLESLTVLINDVDKKKNFQNI